MAWTGSGRWHSPGGGRSTMRNGKSGAGASASALTSMMTRAGSVRKPRWRGDAFDRRWRRQHCPPEKMELPPQLLTRALAAAGPDTNPKAFEAGWREWIVDQPSLDAGHADALGHDICSPTRRGRPAHLRLIISPWFYSTVLAKPDQRRVFPYPRHRQAQRRPVRGHEAGFGRHEPGGPEMVKRPALSFF